MPHTHQEAEPKVTEDANAPAARYATLDVMRLIAAFMVVWGHLSEASHRLAGPPSFQAAVDFFFMLSGFVLALSNDPKFRNGMSPLTFLKRRTIRLLPILLFGAVMSLAIELAWPIEELTWPQALASAVLSIVALPTPSPHPRDMLFPLNHAYWSLFFEFWVANVVYAALWRHLKRIILGVIVVFCAIGVVLTVHRFTNLGGYRWVNMPGGIARVGFGFFGGVCLARIHAAWPCPAKLFGPLLLATLLGAFWAPSLIAHNYILGVFIFVISPLLIYTGATSVEWPPRFSAMLGDTSYAVYALHMPIATRLGAWLASKPWPDRLVTAVALAAMIIFFAGLWLAALSVDRFYDTPVRRWLTRRTAGWFASDRKRLTNAP
jgi:peptidoglycan/LPS O-acetylase OafA/YrhL